MAIAIALVLVVVGSVVFHMLSPWWWTPIASNWSYIDNTLLITFAITGLVFVAVGSFMAYCVFRFRHKPGNQAAYEPENRRLEIWLAVVTSIGVAAMLAGGVQTLLDLVHVTDGHPVPGVDPGLSRPLIQPAAGFSGAVAPWSRGGGVPNLARLGVQDRPAAMNSRILAW